MFYDGLKISLGHGIAQFHP